MPIAISRHQLQFRWNAGAARMMLLAALTLGVPIGVLADDPPPPSGFGAFTPTEQAPGAPAGSYPLSGFDNINLATRHVSFYIPIAPTLGRGSAQIPAGVSIDLGIIPFAPVNTTIDYCDPTTGVCTWNFEYSFAAPSDVSKPFIAGETLFARGWGDGCVAAHPYVGGVLWTETLSTITLSQADGTEIEFVDKLTGGRPLLGVTVSPAGKRGRTFVAHDGSAAVVQIDASEAEIEDPAGCNKSGPLGITGTVTFRDGSVHRFVDGTLTQIRDRNGNMVAMTDNGVYPYFWTITDSLGRNTTITPGLVTTVTYPGYADSQREVTITRDLTPVYRADQQLLFNQLTAQENCGSAEQPAICAKTLFPMYDVFVEDNSQTPLGPGAEIGSIQLPNGRSYTFQLDVYGNIARVVLPTGGAYEYDYDHVTLCTYNGDGKCNYSGASLLKEKRVYADASADPQTGWVQRTTFSGYDGTPNSGLTTVQATVQHFEPNGTSTGQLIGKEVHFFYLGSGSGTRLNPWKGGKEYQTQTYDTNGSTLLETQAQTWNQRSCDTGDRIPCSWIATSYGGLETSLAPAHDPRLTQATVTYPGAVSKTVYGYDAYNNRGSVAEYAFGTSAPGSLIRTTNTLYNTAPGFTNQSAYLNLNIVSLPWTQTVTNEVGTQVASTTWGYDASGALDPLSGVTGWEDVGSVRGNATSVSRWVSGSTSLVSHFRYDAAGNMVEARDPRNVCVRRAYADSGTGGGSTYAFATSQTTYTDLNCTGTAQIARAEYDYYAGQLTSVEDVNGNSTSYAYNDALDRLRSITRPSGGGQTSISYSDIPGSVNAEVIVSDGPDTVTQYDGLGRPIESVLKNACATGNVITKTSYDGKGRKASVWNPSCGEPSQDGPKTEYEYDGLDRIVSVTQPGGAVTTTTYAGAITTITDPAGAARRNTADALGRLVTVVENPNNSPSYTSTYGYDALDNLRTVTQGNQTRTFVYDALKRLTSATNPETGTTAITYGYDDSGNLTTRTDARGTKMLVYDGMNRLTDVTYTDGTSGSYRYDTDAAIPGHTEANYPIGRLKQVSSGDFRTSYRYDALGRVQASMQEVGTSQYVFGYGYNLAGALSSMTYPSGRIVTYGFDDAGRVDAAYNGTAQTDKYATNVTFAPHGAIAGLQLGNNLWENTTFNSSLQPELIGLGTTPGTTNIWHITLGYGTASSNNGNVRSQTITGPGLSGTVSQTYTYDSFNRLKTMTEAGGCAQLYSYDQYGNRAVVTGTGYCVPSTTYTPNLPADDPGQVQSIFPNNRWTGASYDTVGNESALPGWQFQYDTENRMKQATSSMTTATYAYDGDGRRVQRTVNGTTTTYVYDAMGNLAAEYGGEAATGGRVYLTSDHLGSTRLITNASGTAVECRDYFPFGEEMTSGTRTGCYGADVAKQKFTGKERDQETGLDYFGARYLSGAQGRFTSPDPKQFTARTVSSPQKWNKYVYVRNNPFVLIDPDGEDDFYVFLAADKTVSKEWMALQSDARNLGHNVIVWAGGDANELRFAAAVNTPDANVVFAGDTIDTSDRQQAVGVLLGNNGGVGDRSIFESTAATDTQPSRPLLSPSVRAFAVAVFGCNSEQLQPYYSKTAFTGVSPTVNSVASGDAALAYTAARVRGQSPSAATGPTQAAMAATTKRANANPKRVMEYTIPTVTTHVRNGSTMVCSSQPDGTQTCTTK